MAITLDSLRKSLDAKYAHTEVVLDATHTIILKNPTRLDADSRKSLMSWNEEFAAIENTDLDAQEAHARALITRVTTPSEAKALFKALDSTPGDGFILLMEVINGYLGSQGEASPSES